MNGHRFCGACGSKLDDAVKNANTLKAVPMFFAGTLFVAGIAWIVIFAHDQPLVGKFGLIAFGVASMLCYMKALYNPVHVSCSTCSKLSHIL